MAKNVSVTLFEESNGEGSQLTGVRVLCTKSAWRQYSGEYCFTSGLDGRSREVASPLSHLARKLVSAGSGTIALTIWIIGRALSRISHVRRCVRSRVGLYRLLLMLVVRWGRELLVTLSMGWSVSR